MLTPEEADACRRFHWNPAGYLKRKREMVVHQDERGAGHAHFTVKERSAPTTTEEALRLSVSPERRRRLVERGLLRQIDGNYDFKTGASTPPVLEKEKHGMRSTRRKYAREPRPDDERRDAVIFCALIQKLKGKEYCQFLSQNRVYTPSSWWHKGAKEYPAAYKKPHYKNLIHKQKSRVANKLAELEQSHPKALEDILRRHGVS